MEDLNTSIVNEDPPDGYHEFPWDGSDLGIHHMDIIARENHQLMIWYARIQIDDLEGIGVLCRIKNKFPIICDELKSLFGAPKTGTHTITFGNDMYMWSRCGVIGRRIVTTDVKLNKTIPQPSEHEVIRDIRSLFTFRWVMSLTSTNEGSIMMRGRNIFNVTPISIREFKSDIQQTRPILTSAVIKKWFNGITPENSLIECLGINLSDPDFQSDEFRFSLRQQLTQVINRIDRTYIHVIDNVINKVVDAIQIIQIETQTEIS